MIVLLSSSVNYLSKLVVDLIHSSRDIVGISTGQFQDLIHQSEIITLENSHSRINPSIYAISTIAKKSLGGDNLIICCLLCQFFKGGYPKTSPAVFPLAVCVSRKQAHCNTWQ